MQMWYGEVPLPQTALLSLVTRRTSGVPTSFMANFRISEHWSTLLEAHSLNVLVNIDGVLPRHPSLTAEWPFSPPFVTYGPSWKGRACGIVGEKAGAARATSGLPGGKRRSKGEFTRLLRNYHISRSKGIQGIQSQRYCWTQQGCGKAGLALLAFQPARLPRCAGCFHHW